ncbi:formate C-acetyltransferase [Clostridium estertheticum]|uniref:formate C-acetyltransferase n=1 Tax=Clostridium estertheticum TaxID=238834 RepID=UPI001C7E0A42|nr:formate C-acetyltransferase [Clostridium estertheticum]MBX4264460.1 formate C-acetyltransferase [Clostridium estertheticum]WLC89299.1 formate C-acetyltransferase [Clostridium estertheticum]
MTSDRIQKLKNQLFENKREVSLERALLYTESYKETEGQSSLIRRAKATAHILGNVQISIREEELIVGNRTTKPRSGIISPEMDPYWINDELDTLESRPQDPFFISDANKKIYREVLYPYWVGKSLKDYINKKLTPEVRVPSDLDIFKLNQTDKGQGHIIPNFEKLLNSGLGQIVNETLLLSKEHPGNDFYQASIITLKASQTHILRYADLAKLSADGEPNKIRQAELLEIARISTKISSEKPENFYEACQLLWFLSVILQYESNASSLSLGGFDKYMYHFYENDLKNGITKEILRETLTCLWIKTNDVVLIRSSNSATYFAGFPTGYTITLGGLTQNGRSAVNSLSYLALDTYQDIRLPQPNLGVRVNELIEPAFLKKTAETIRLGTGIPQIFNDEVIVPGFLNRGVSLEDSRDYSVVGCVELSLPGKTYGLHDIALFNLLKIMEISLRENKNDENITFDEIIQNIKKNINKYVKLMVEGSNIVDTSHKEFAPIPLLSCFINNCLDTGKDVTYGGAKYNFSGVQGIGIANLSDSLYALKKIVFDEKRISLKDLVDALDSNFQGVEHEKLRVRLINKYDKFGNDNDEVDNLSSDILRYYSKTVEQHITPRGGTFVPGSYTVSAHIPLGKSVGATPDGRKAGEQLADGGLSPMVGRDVLGPTAVLKSVSKLDNYLTTNGSLLNVKFSPKTLEGEEGIHKLCDFLYAFMKLKIQHIQFNVVSVETLKSAQASPNDYKGLVIRVAGYSAFFIELSREIQDDIIRRTQHNL